MRRHRLGPLPEIRRPFSNRRAQLSRVEPSLRQRDQADHERACQNLGQGDFVTSAEERLCVLEQRLQLLDQLVDGRVDDGLGVGVGLGAEELHEAALELGEVGVDEEADARAALRAAGGVGRRQKLPRVRVGEEPRHDGGLGEDLAVVRHGWHQAARVDG